MIQSAIMGFGPGNGNGESWEGTRYSIITLNDMMDQVMSMVSLLDTIGLVIFIILLVITMVGITNTFRMIMLERTREIGTIRAIGMQRKSVRNFPAGSPFYRVWRRCMRCCSCRHIDGLNLCHSHGIG